MDKYAGNVAEETQEEELLQEEELSDTLSEKKGKPGLYSKVLLIYLGVLAAIVVGLLLTLWIALFGIQASYEKQAADLAAQIAELQAQRDHEKAVYRAPQIAFETWLSQTTAEYWTELWFEQSECPLDDRDKVYEYMEECFSPESIKAFKSSDYTAETPIFIIKNEDRTLAGVTVSGSDLDWSVSKVDIMFEGAESTTVLATGDSRVFCNGTELGSEYCGEENISFFRYALLEEELVQPVTWISYELKGLLFRPEVNVEAPEGYYIAQSPEGDQLLYLQEPIGSYSQHAVNFVRAYLYYYMSGEDDTWANLANALSYLVSGTQAYKDLWSTFDGVYWNYAYGNIDTSKTTADDMIVWADNCFSVDVNFDADATYRGSFVNYADGVMRIYFLQGSSGYYISNFEIM